MQTITLQFRAKVPKECNFPDDYFYQKNQYLTSFLRRVLGFWNISHPTYLDENLEDKLEILLEDEWVKCHF